MSQTVGDFFRRRLHDCGVNIIFGCPSDGINGLLGKWAFEQLGLGFDGTLDAAD
jgi:hypothetical protein